MYCLLLLGLLSLSRALLIPKAIKAGDTIGFITPASTVGGDQSAFRSRVETAMASLSLRVPKKSPQASCRTGKFVNFLTPRLRFFSPGSCPACDFGFALALKLTFFRFVGEHMLLVQLVVILLQQINIELMMLCLCLPTKVLLVSSQLEGVGVQTDFLNWYEPQAGACFHLLMVFFDSLIIQ